MKENEISKYFFLMNNNMNYNVRNKYSLNENA